METKIFGFRLIALVVGVVVWLTVLFGGAAFTFLLFSSGYGIVAVLSAVFVSAVLLSTAIDLLIYGFDKVFVHAE